MRGTWLRCSACMTIFILYSCMYGWIDTCVFGRQDWKLKHNAINAVKCHLHYAVGQIHRFNVDQLYWRFEWEFFLVALNQFCAMVTPFELLVAWFVSDIDMVLFFVPDPAVAIAGVAKAWLVSSMLSSSLPCLWLHLASPLSLSFSLFSCTHRDCST